MTSLDRELAMADNLAYVKRVLASLPAARTLVFAGFSQGASMAARAAADNRCAGLIMLGGDVPPDVKRDGVQLPPVLLGRGTRDDWYTEEKLAADAMFLERVTRVRQCVFEGGHEWSDEYRRVAGEFLGELI
jgi:predicted esterase